MRSARPLFLLLVALLVATVWGSQQPQSPTTNIIHVQIDGLRNDKGKVVCSLYASADGFPKDADKAKAHTSAAITDKRAVCDFAGIAPNATYAVSVFHDENANGKLDTNFMGMPREGVGASNGAK